MAPQAQPQSESVAWKHPLAKVPRLWQSTRLYHVQDAQVVTSAQALSASIPQFVQTTNWPAGNIIYKKLIIRISGTLNVTVATGNSMTVVAKGIAKLIQSLYLRFSNIEYVVNGLDGLTLYRMLCAKLRKQLYLTDVASVAAGSSNTADPFEVVLEIPFQDQNAARPEDTGIDMLIAGSPTLTINWAAGTTAMASISGSGNTLNLNALNVKIDVEVIDPPNGKIALPLFKPFYDALQTPITQTSVAFPINLPFNDRKYCRMFVSQRDSATLAELADTIIGVNDSDKLSLKLNNDALWDQENWLLEEHRQNADYGTAVLGSGQILMDFMRRKSGGYRYGDAVDVETSETGNLKAYLDVTAPAGSPAIWMGFDCIQTLKSNQQRAANLV